MPIGNLALKSIKMLHRGTLKTYRDLSRDMLTANADVLNADLLAFIETPANLSAVAMSASERSAVGSGLAAYGQELSLL